LAKGRSEQLAENAADNQRRCRDWLLRFMQKSQPRFLTKDERVALQCTNYRGLSMTTQKWRFSFLGFDAPDEMLEMELNRLYFRFSMIDVATIDGDIEKKCYEHLQTCFKAPPNQWNEKTWDDAYRIEKQIAMLLTGDFLHHEIKARLREAGDRKARDAANLESDYNSLRKAIQEKHMANGDGLLRDLLREILESIHWNSKLKYLRRKLRLEATRNILLFVMTALVCVLVIYFIYSQVLSPILLLLMVATCGLLGALFSQLIKLHLQWDVITLEELRYWKALPYIFLRSCIGVCGALILYFILQSQTVRGSIFPQLDGLTSKDPDKDTALLIMWSIIAGFSESLVPSILSTTGRNLREARE
jgi:hypothetical protein